LALIPVVVAAVASGGCEKAAVGVLTPTTGDAEIYGRAVNNGVQVALAEAQRQRLLPPGFEVLEADTASSPKRAATELRYLAQRHRVPLVVAGVTASEARALIAVAERERVVCISPCAPANRLARRSRFFYRLHATDEAEGSAAARYLVRERGVRRVVVYSDGSPLTRVVEAEFRQHFELLYGGEITATVNLGDDRWDLRSADAYHANRPQAAYIVGRSESIERVLRHLHERDIEVIRCTTSAFDVGGVMRRYGYLAEDVVFSLAPAKAASGDRPVGGFVKAYHESFGEPPDAYAAHGYDAMRLALRCLCTANARRAAEVRRFFSLELAQSAGETGVISLDGGPATGRPAMHCVWRGQVMSCGRLEELKRRAVRDLVNGLLPASPAVRPPFASHQI